MNNKLVYVLLALIIVVAGGTAYYSYTLNQRLDALGQTLSGYQAEQAGRLGSVSDNLARLETETGSRLDALGSQLAGARGDISSLGGSLAADEDRLAFVETAVTGISGNVSDLSGRLGAAEARLSSAVFDASAAYARVSPATVRITDGQTVIDSGFIYDTEGHVVTAYHVIDGLSPIIVVTDDGRFFDAEVIGYSDLSDVAVLKLDGDPAIAPPALGDSSRLRIGDQVAAIGSPLDIPDTLTAGVISRVNRYTNYGLDNTSVPNLLQFDAPVNPGNSGGPLVNGAGEIVGIVVARIVASQGDGIYYAVASNKVKRAADAIIAGGSFPYPWLGVGIADLTPDDAQASGLDTISGVSVSSVDASGPAQAAGIHAGDIIISINGQTVHNMDELTSYLGENLSPGDRATITVLRGGTSLGLNIVIGTR